MGNFDITINNVYDTDQLVFWFDENEVVTAENNFVVIEAIMQNYTQNRAFFSEGMIKYVSDNVNYDPYYYASYLENGFQVIKAFNEKEKTEISFVFESPSTHKEEDYLKIYSSAHSKEYAIFKLA